MDFPQQVEETLLERPPSAYDVVMESPIYVLERKARQHNYPSGKQLDNAIAAAVNATGAGDKMCSSLNSTLEDTTPSDSGVQLLDSECSELMVDSISSQNGFEFDDTKYLAVQQERAVEAKTVEQAYVMDSNSNVTNPPEAVEDVMTSSNCSTFDTENIVYRRKIRKTQAVSNNKAPKKRVSFHEDILKSTRTDNIHIEHGFITYKNGRKFMQQVGGTNTGRYSWCSEGNGAAGAANKNMQLCAGAEDGEGEAGQGQRRCVVYRNACSDVLDYGVSDNYETNLDATLHYDNSGVFEYLPHNKQEKQTRVCGDGQVLYNCSCSSSNSSLDSEENDKNSNRQQYGQAKSSSCDCIGNSQTNNNLIGENCYYSDPNIDNMQDNYKKSVWNKEKKPKSSCLKKTKRHTNIIHEQDLSTKVKKFNVHNMNQLIDNSSKMIFGSLKSIFTIPLPERGVPEGSEDLQTVVECVPEMETSGLQAKVNDAAKCESPTIREKPFLSKSLDGSKQQQAAKKFVHNVDEQLRRKKVEDMYAPSRQNSDEENKEKKQQQQPLQVLQAACAKLETSQSATATITTTSAVVTQTQQFRNKFIINCESTVFEHTGVSYSYEATAEALASENAVDFVLDDAKADVTDILEEQTLVAEAAPDKLHSAFITVPIKRTFSNFFRSLTESTTLPAAGASKSLAMSVGEKSGNTANKREKSRDKMGMKATSATNSFFAVKMQQKKEIAAVSQQNNTKSLPSSTSCSTISDLVTSNTSTNTSNSNTKAQMLAAAASKPYRNSDLERSSANSRHLPSPLRKRGNNALQTSTLPPRYCDHYQNASSSHLSPDLFNAHNSARGGSGRDSKSTILSEEFDDILTITTTTDTDRNDSDIVILDYPPPGSATDYANLLKPPQAKTSLINRFLRNVTQKKILETSIRRNSFFAQKLRSEEKLFARNLYVPGAKPKNYDLIEDLNAEIAMEIEMSGSAANSPRRELARLESDELPGDGARFELGMGEVAVDRFNGSQLTFLRDPHEQLIKVFKLYVGYSREGYMTPVLVFLTDKNLYVTDLVRSRLCSKFVLAYNDLDVILLGPYGNTVLLSNTVRDMQQVLLAGGPYPAAGLVANLELCARRSGSTLPAVGQLTLEHLAPLQTYVRENSCVDKKETWVYYAIVNVPAGTIGAEEREPLGPHVKGFLMHRRIKENISNCKQAWNPGYFLLKAGVLYMFNDSSQRLPSWAMALAECQGARRAVKSARPHCFEILLKEKLLLQLAAPDEYVASEWLQALLQAASGLFELQEKHKTLGCTLVLTQQHLITLREDFETPLRQLNDQDTPTPQLNEKEAILRTPQTTTTEECHSLLSSAMSTPTRGNDQLHSCSSLNSTPTKNSQHSLSTTTGCTNTTTNTSNNQLRSAATNSAPTRNVSLRKLDDYLNRQSDKQTNTSNMSSFYGKKSGLEILSCADIKEMTGIKIPSHNDTWWCILEFSCQEVRESTDDLVLLFASSSEMQRFLRILEQLWQTKHHDLFPISVLDEDDAIAEQCTLLYMDINRAWEPLLTAALGYPL